MLSMIIKKISAHLLITCIIVVMTMLHGIIPVYTHAVDLTSNITVTEAWSLSITPPPFPLPEPDPDSEPAPTEESTPSAEPIPETQPDEDSVANPQTNDAIFYPFYILPALLVIYLLLLRKKKRIADDM